jgi:ribosome-binding factor A
MGSPKEQELCMYGLKHASGFVQSKLADRLQTRFTPVIQFVLDQGVKKSIEMTRLINEALGRPSQEAEPADGTAEEQLESEESEPSPLSPSTGARGASDS